MFSGWPIRKKLTLGIALLLVSVTILAVSGFSNVYSLRGLVRNISLRATELPWTLMLAESTGALRATLPDTAPEDIRLSADAERSSISDRLMRSEFAGHMAEVRRVLESYQQRLRDNASATGYIGNIDRELENVRQMQATLNEIDTLYQASGQSWPPADEVVRSTINDAVDQLNFKAGEIPRYLYDKMLDLQGEVRLYYRFWIVLTWVTSLAAGLLIVLLLHLFYRWVFLPLRTLINGSRRVAYGDFNHRIRLNSGDEMDELAQAMNDMTERFQEIRDDLDRQVKQRTREVIRGEQLASVGFLAAGVAHEINNPMASIAFCAESLERRLEEVLAANPELVEKFTTGGENHWEVIQDYLKMVQTEAFRCKAITGRLLDFSRLGDIEKQQVELSELVQAVIDMVRHLGNYKHKQITFRCHGSVLVPVNAQEMKQVVLNLITNGLESLDPGGTVSIDLSKQRDEAVLVVEDNGCGMTDEVKAHLFEPFFTRRRDGQGTGLGMSITYRIINEHGGRIDVHSNGPGTGSRLTVHLPLNPEAKENQHRYQAA
jgi:signal transduction histidine kinase